MDRNNQKQFRILLLEKITLVIFGLFLTLVLIEIGLRIGGIIILSLQEYKNIVSVKERGEYRILVLGESITTWGGGSSYPSQLEEILNQHNLGVKFSVINKGRMGTTTPTILSKVPFYLDKYDPDIVVVMMGINDSGMYIPVDKPSSSKTVLFLRSFRTYKLTRLLWLHMVTKLKEIKLSMLTQYTQSTKEYQSGFLTNELKELHAEQKDNIKNEDTLKKAIAPNRWDVNTYLELGRFYYLKHKFQQAIKYLKEGIYYFPQNEKLYRALAKVYEETGRSALAQEYYLKADKLRLGEYSPGTVANYHKLKEILDKRKIKLLCVQYPMRSIVPLKRVFEADDKGIIFVDNEKIFKESAKRNGYKEYFVDMFAGDFGHCTPKGNWLLAESIANAIVKEGGTFVTPY